MDDEIKEIIDNLLKEWTFNGLKDRITKLLGECKERKEDAIRKKRDIGNSDEHIEMCYDIIDYLNSLISENRNKKINSLFERKILSFNEFKLYNSIII